MKTRIVQWQRLLGEPYVGEMLFWSGFIMHLGRNVWATTMFPFPGRLSQVMLLLPVVLIFLKIILYDTYTMRELCFVIPAGLIVSITCIGSGYLGSGLWLLVIMGCKNIPFDKILRVYLVTAGVICFLAFCASMLGVIEDLVYHNPSHGVRHSFGIIYCTDFAAHIFFLVLVLYYLAWENLRWHHFAATIAAAAVVYYFCRARLDSSCMLLTAMLFGLDHFLRRGGRRHKKWLDLWRRSWERTGPWIFPALAVLSVAMTICYSASSPILRTIDRLVTGRLRLGRDGIEQYGIRLLGQQIEMHGMGGSSRFPENYFFLDCSYVNILLRLGVLFFPLLLFVYFASAYKWKKDRAFLMAIALVAVNCMIAHHLMETAYNPFACALFAKWNRDRLVGQRGGGNDGRERAMGGLSFAPGYADREQG